MTPVFPGLGRPLGGISAHATLRHFTVLRVPRGGSAAITHALVSYLRWMGGEARTGAPVRTLDELPPAGVVLLDLTPR